MSDVAQHLPYNRFRADGGAHVIFGRLRRCTEHSQLENGNRSKRYVLEHKDYTRCGCWAEGACMISDFDNA